VRDLEEWVGEVVVVEPLGLFVSACIPPVVVLAVVESFGDWRVEEWVDDVLRGGEMGQVGVKAPVALPGLMKNLDSNSNASNR